MEKLSPKHRQAIIALLTCSSIDGAAQECGQSDKTLHKWLKEPLFRQALEEAESELLQQVARQMTTASGEALETLRAVLADPDASIRDKIAAARAVLTHLPNFRILGSIEQRLEALRGNDA